jgi:hypothetical protein
MALKQQAGAGCTPVVDAEVSGDIEHAPTPDEQEEPGPPASLRPPSSAFAVVRASARGALVGRPRQKQAAVSRDACLHADAGVAVAPIVMQRLDRGSPSFGDPYAMRAGKA